MRKEIKFLKKYINEFDKKNVVCRLGEEILSGYINMDDNGEFASLIFLEDIKKEYPIGEQVVVYLEYKNCMIEVQSKVDMFDMTGIKIDMPQELTLIEHREFLRTDCDISCRVNSNMQTRIVNISGCGACLDTNGAELHSIKIGDEIVIAFVLYDLNCIVRARLISIENQIARVEFIDINDTVQSRIVKFALLSNAIN